MMVEQELGEDVPVVPALKEQDRRHVIKVVKEEAKQLELAKNAKSCIVCGKVATHCMRGLPNNTYCKECALEHFKFLNYLERL